MNSPVASYLRAVLGVHLVTLRAAWRAKDRGASAVDLAVITHFVKGAAKQIQSTTP